MTLCLETGEKWKMVIEALRELGKDGTVEKLQLGRLQNEADLITNQPSGTGGSVCYSRVEGMAFFHKRSWSFIQ